MTREIEVERIIATNQVLKFETILDRRTAREMAWNFVNAWPLLLGILAWMVVASALCAWLPQNVAPEFCINGALPAHRLVGIVRALYYNASMLTSVGAADIAPASTGARAISLIDSWLGVVLLGLIVGMACTAFEASKTDGVAKSFLKSMWVKLSKVGRRSPQTETKNATGADRTPTPGIIEPIESEGEPNAEGTQCTDAGDQTTDRKPEDRRTRIYKAMLEHLGRGWAVAVDDGDSRASTDFIHRVSQLQMTLDRMLATVDDQFAVTVVDEHTEGTEDKSPRSYAVLSRSLLIEISVALGETAVLMNGNDTDRIEMAIQETWKSSVVVGQSLLLPEGVFNSLINGLRTAQNVVFKLVLGFGLSAGAPPRPRVRL